MYPDPTFLQQEARGRMTEVLEAWQKDRMAVFAERSRDRDELPFGRSSADALRQFPVIGRALHALLRRGAVLPRPS